MKHSVGPLVLGQLTNTMLLQAAHLSSSPAHEISSPAVRAGLTSCAAFPSQSAVVEGTAVVKINHYNSMARPLLIEMDCCILFRQWHRNQDANPVAVDQVYIIRNTTECPSRAGAAAAHQPSPGMSGTTPAQAPVKSFSSNLNP